MHNSKNSEQVGIQEAGESFVLCMWPSPESKLMCVTFIMLLPRNQTLIAVELHEHGGKEPGRRPQELQGDAKQYTPDL